MSSAWNRLVRRFRRLHKRKSTLTTLGRRIVSQKQYLALMQCLDYLSENISYFGLFLSSGNLTSLDKIYQQIESGNPNLIDMLNELSSPRECAMATHRFIRSYKILILPERALNILCARNEGIPRRLVALDVLNLVHHELSGPKLEFARAYLQMMQHLTLRGYLTPTEIRIVISPYLAVPALFPGRNSMQFIASKSACLMEVFLSTHLLDNPEALSHELATETRRFERKRRDRFDDK
ncbi:uncharacterized protein LOC129747395 isoform X2 [Uranotaenia lowii]|uniref:uncharacterized protein LOC129747395 isoform X2 n=1 Tax=Uranotaenia lowii TaxID=190385 RepID=UPI002478D27D|nr:uncharacterized protein LOC129747395 isoform X2 [Uranotaenia lowii]